MAGGGRPPPYQPWTKGARMSSFLQVSDRWLTDHPGASAGVVGLSGLTSPSEYPALEAATAQVEEALAGRFSDRAAIKEDPVIQAYTAYYKRFKKTYQVASQVESVALKGRSIPRLMPTVQAMFTAELKNMILTAGHDRVALAGPVRLESSIGDESFITISGKDQPLKPGDMFMADDKGIISDVIYGPDSRSKITAQTSEALFAAYAPAGVPPEAVQAHLEDIAAFCRLISDQVAVDFLEVHTA